MYKVSDIFNYTESFAPIETAAPWDNCGILVGDKNAYVTKALLCLDITNDVIQEAKEKGCELIISHHPVIFNPLKSVHKDSIVYNLIKADITTLCLHTNLDLALDTGVNVSLAKQLNLLELTPTDDGFLFIGKLSTPLSADAFAQHVKTALNCSGVRYTLGRDVSTVAISSGAGSDGIELYEKYGFDAFATGELKHHHFLYAKEKDICAVEAGHFNTEDVVINPLIEKLSANYPDISFIKSTALTDPINFI